MCKKIICARFASTAFRIGKSGTLVCSKGKTIIIYVSCSIHYYYNRVHTLSEDIFRINLFLLMSNVKCMLPNILININYNQIVFLLINVFYLVVFSLILLHNNNCFVTSQSHSNRDLFLVACGICLSFSNVDVRIIRKRLNFVCLRIRVRHRELHHFILTCIVIIILKLLSR